jgi:tubulin alpha
MIFNAIGGGTGSGLGHLIGEKLSIDYNTKITKMGFIIYPSPEIKSNVLEPYNAVLSTHSMLEYHDITVMYDNQAI